MRAHVSCSLGLALLLLCAAAPATAQEAAPDFGDDSGAYAHDGQCDDPRFMGRGASGGFPDHELRDASDCRAAYDRRRVAMLSAQQLATPLFAGVEGGIDYGDNSGIYANDGQCDDPRFMGETVSRGFTDHELADAADCRDAVAAGEARLMTAEDIAALSFTGIYDGVDFGDNEGAYAGDGECDDPRFSGDGASRGFDEEEMHDAADCYIALRAGTVTQRTPEQIAARNFIGVADGIDFGDNSGDFVRDGECDDPRFSGQGSSNGAFPDQIMRDSADCYIALGEGTVTLTGPAAGVAAVAVAETDGAFDFGDDAGIFANDGECDDPRLEGPGLSGEGLQSHAGHDATDCRTAFDAGQLTLRSREALIAAGFFSGIYDGIDFGADDGTYSRDGQCDDPRFLGPATSQGRFPDHEYHDSADCKAAYEAGGAWLKGHGIDPETARYDGVDFGDNRGEFPNDDLCDDPRFAGEGLSDAALLPADIGHDARDCMIAWMDGRLELAPPAETEAEE